MRAPSGGMPPRGYMPPPLTPLVRCEHLPAACLPAGICPLSSHHWSDASTPAIVCTTVLHTMQMSAARETKLSHKRGIPYALAEAPSPPSPRSPRT
eukprot:1186452-Prorocentrum_minimum.AAC.2